MLTKRKSLTVDIKDVQGATLGKIDALLEKNDIEDLIIFHPLTHLEKFTITPAALLSIIKRKDVIEFPLEVKEWLLETFSDSL